MGQSSEKVVLHEGDIQRALTRIAHEIAERNPQASGDPHDDSRRAENGASPSGAPSSASHAGSDLAIVGIHRRGAFLAQRLRAELEDLLHAAIPLGDLDIGFYRDDVASRPDAPIVHASHIDFDIAGRTVVIVDDVLFTGRTVRAAIEALFDYGRPERVQLAVLADRGHRELPIRPDYVGKNLPTSRAEHVHVRLRELDGVDEVAIAPIAVEIV
ncbi:MAG: bifunctional pyr operon transcriptional regulator/uracil phosphoribosyltransferase PyrR [Solirubrobacterales bacterium]